LILSALGFLPAFTAVVEDDGSSGINSSSAMMILCIGNTVSRWTKISANISSAARHDLDTIEYTLDLTRHYHFTSHSLITRNRSYHPPNRKTASPPDLSVLPLLITSEFRFRFIRIKAITRSSHLHEIEDTLFPLCPDPTFYTIDHSSRF
jgi:hypothetical protein